MPLSVTQVYTSVACNRTSEAADWNADGLICFGACNAVVIYDTKLKVGDPLLALNHHKSRVNSVKWLINKTTSACKEFISCSADKTASICTFVNKKWEETYKLIGHNEGVTCAHGAYTNDTDLLICTASIDSTVRIWERCNGVVNQKQIINLNSGLCLTLHVQLLPTSSKPVLLCALDDHKVHLYGGDDEYHRLHTLVGHEDWIRGLDVLDVDQDTIIVASASQDTYIRLWRIQKKLEQYRNTGVNVEEKIFNAYEQDWCVKLEAVLAGHEGWVYGVQWHPYQYDKDTGKMQPVYRLLSSSLDKTLIVWEPESFANRTQGEGVWVEKVRVGEVGGNGLGFYGSRFGPNGTSFMGHGYNGSLHIWKLNEETGEWQPTVVCGGHCDSVEDVRWEPHRGRYIVSVSTDQTTRIHAPWKRADGVGIEWHEIARPQVHGYDMASIAPITSTVFASAAEEKVIRVFQAPHNFHTNFENITGEKLANDRDDHGVEPEGASVPSLGLSNKAVFTDEEKESGVENEKDGYFVPINLKEPPTEETLMQNTLWPETQKLYGHGYEVFTLDASPDGDLVASACRATRVEHAAILLWDTSNWQQIQKLESHQLTVTQLSFSPDSQWLLSVSRDRRWFLHQRQPSTKTFFMVACTDKSNGVHSRIIWCCAWAHDGQMFATGSREGKVCVWSKQKVKTESSLSDYGLLGKSLEITNVSVTALAFAPICLEGSRLIVTGLDTGAIGLYFLSMDGEWNLIYKMENSMAHHRPVKRLTFKPQDGSKQSKELLLASCGEDHLVRINSIIVSQI